MNTHAHTATSIRCAANANDMTSTTIARSIKYLMPARPSLVSRRKKFTVAPKAKEWMKMVQRTAPAPTVKGVTIATGWTWVIGLLLVVIIEVARNCGNYMKLVSQSPHGIRRPWLGLVRV